MRKKVELLFLIFFVSGFSGLIYESVWSHYVKLFLGHAAYAQTLVLVVFIGGLALGAWLVSRRVERLRNPLRLYAVVDPPGGDLPPGELRGAAAIQRAARTRHRDALLPQ